MPALTFSPAAPALSARAHVAQAPSANRAAAPATARRAAPIRCSTGDDKRAEGLQATRRDVIYAAAAAAMMPVLGKAGPAAAAIPKATAQVGEFLPPAGVKDMVKYELKKDQTPALRAGTIPNAYYFFLPPSFLILPVANAISGNYCQPRCDEPWTEVKFEDLKMANVAVIATALEKITRGKNNVQIDYIGEPKTILDSFAANITGDIPVEDEEIVSMEVLKKGSQVYYLYELDVPYSNYGQHQLACVTTKGEACLILTAKCNAKQWSDPKNREYLYEVQRSLTI